MVYQRILVAVDRSTASSFALGMAIDVAKDYQARLRIIHVIQSVATLEAEGPNLEAMDAAWHREAQRILDHASGVAAQAGVVAEIALVENERRGIGEAIAADGDQWSADLIVLGAHDHRGMRRILMHRVATETIAHTPVPVLLIRDHTP